MTTTIPAGGYDAGANDVPGMAIGTDTTTGIRHTGFMDAGTCSKAVRALPALAKYFKSLRNVLMGVQSATKSNTNAVSNLLQGQADINNQTNVLNYWMRQASPQMDKLQTELQAGNDALVGMDTTSNGSKSDAPGVPDALTLLPSAEVNKLLFYFVRPQYQGASVVTGYELVIFSSIAHAKSFTNASTSIYLSEETLAAATLTPPWNTEHCDDMFMMYGADLRIVTSVIAPDLTTDKCVRIRAKNNSGPHELDIWGEWSAPTMLCRAAASPLDLQPEIEDITTGCLLSLVSWRVPMILQADNSYAMVGGIHSYMVNGTVARGGSTNIAQISLDTPGTVLVKVGACTSDNGTVPFAESDEVSVIVPSRVTPPQISARLVNDGTGTYAMIACSLHDYYTDTAITYKVTSIDDINATLTNLRTVDIAHDVDNDSPNEVRIPAGSAYLTPGYRYKFSATAEHAVAPEHVSLPSSLSRVFDIPGVRPDPMAVIFAAQLADYIPEAIITSNLNPKNVVFIPSEDATQFFRTSKALSASVWDTTEEPPSNTHMTFVASGNIQASTMTIADNGYIFVYRDGQTLRMDKLGMGGPLSTVLNPPNGATLADASISMAFSVNALLAVVLDDDGSGDSGIVIFNNMKVISFNNQAEYDLSSNIKATQGPLPPEDMWTGKTYIALACGGRQISYGSPAEFVNYLVALTDGGDAHLWTLDYLGNVDEAINPGRRPVIIPAMSSASSTSTTVRIVMNKTGDTFLVYDGLSNKLTMATRVSTTWELSAQTTIDVSISTNTQRLYINEAGDRLMAIDTIAGGGGGTTQSRLWKRTDSVWSVYQILYPFTDAQITTAKLRMVMTSDGKYLLAADKTLDSMNIRIGLIP